MTKNMRNRGVRALLAASAATLGLAGGAQAQTAEPCIGASWELTGALAHTGLQIRYAVEVALDEINAAGGILGEEVTLRAYDDQGEPGRAVDNALRIGEQDNCVVMLGGFRTPNAIALREPLVEMGLPWVGVISAGTRVIEHENGENEWMFRVSMKDRWVAPFLVEQAMARAPEGGIGLLYEATGWGQGAVPDVEAAM
jgi:branched-chain amino acid transport system substrate-binding protein